jgi:hypothetical protein
LRELGAATGPSIPVADTVMRNGIVPVVPAYHDSIANEDCNPVWTPEGLVRCIPTSVHIVSDEGPDALYSDPSCQTPAYYCGDATCGTTAAIAIADDKSLGMRATTINMLVQVSTVYSIDGTGTCTQVVNSPTGLWGQDQALPWDAYPELVEVNRR